MRFSELELKFIDILIESGPKAISSYLSRYLGERNSTISYIDEISGTFSSRIFKMNFLPENSEPASKRCFYKCHPIPREFIILQDSEIALDKDGFIINEEDLSKAIDETRKLFMMSTEALMAPFTTLNTLMEMIESALHLISVLVEESLIIKYELDLPPNNYYPVLGVKSTYEESDLETIDITESNINLSKNLEQFLKINIIVLPGLKIFKQNGYKTQKEVERDRELKMLKMQTWFIGAGIFISAVITLISALIPQPNTKEVKAITESIDMLATKVDQLNTNQESPGQVSDSQFVIPNN